MTIPPDAMHGFKKAVFVGLLAAIAITVYVIAFIIGSMVMRVWDNHHHHAPASDIPSTGPHIFPATVPDDGHTPCSLTLGPRGTESKEGVP